MNKRSPIKPMLAKALVLDFDGTIRRSKSGATFIKDANDIELIPGVEPIIHKYKEQNYIILGVSNQGGVAFGFKTPQDISDERDATIALFQENPFHFIKMCYHHPGGTTEPYCHRSLGRKPSTGLLYSIEGDAWEYGIVIDWDNSLFVGDRPEDEECAKNAGIPFKHIDQFLTDEPVFEK